MSYRFCIEQIQKTLNIFKDIGYLKEVKFCIKYARGKWHI